MECIIAKIFGSESQKEAAIELLMKTHGGRSFLHGHLFGDNVHEYLAPCIYEGEGEMLSMAFFKSLVKQHGVQFFEPIGKALQRPASRSRTWPTRPTCGPCARRRSPTQMAGRPKAAAQAAPELPAMPEALRRHADFARSFLQRSPHEISGTMSKHQLGLADRQCRMSELSQRCKTPSRSCARRSTPPGRTTKSCARLPMSCARTLTRKITGKRPATATIAQSRSSGEAIAEGGFKSIAGLDAGEIMMPYDNNYRASRPNGSRPKSHPRQRRRRRRSNPPPPLHYRSIRAPNGAAVARGVSHQLTQVMHA